MATQVFLHDTAATTHRGTNTAGLNAATSGWLPKATGTSRGAGVVSKITNTVAGPTNGIEITNGAAATRLEWITDPVDADVTISGTITANIWALESGNTVNATIQVRVQKVAAATGTLTQIAQSTFATELTTGNLARNFTVTPTSTAVNKGDRLRITVFADDASSNMTVGTVTTAYAGTTAAASGDTYISFTETFGFQTAGTGTLVSQPSGPDGAGGNSDIYGGAGGQYAQSVTLASASTVTGADVFLDKLGSPTDNLILDFVATLDGTVLATSTIAASGVSTTAGLRAMTFSSPVSVAAGTYYLQMYRSGAQDLTNRIQWMHDATAPYAGGSQWYGGGGSGWTQATSRDHGFILYGTLDLFTGSTLYLTDTASAVATADVDREAWTSRGAGVQNDVTSTTAGWTSPIQVTDTAAGTTALITQNAGASTGDIEGAVGTAEMRAQGFTLASTSTIDGVDLWLSKIGTPADNMVLDIVSTLGGGVLATASVAASTVTGSSAAVRFSVRTSLAAGSYFLLLSRSGARSTSNYVTWHGDATNPYAGGTSWNRSSSVWTESTTLDRRFIIYEGSPVSWFTKPLTAFTLSGLVKVNRRVLASNAAANASVGVEIARVDNDGTNATVWGYANRDAATTSGGAGEVATTETAYTVYVSGDDLAVSDGQRIRIRLYQDDCADVPTVTGHSLTSYYGGTSGGASGDTYLILGQSLTEFSAGTTVSVTPGAVTFAGQSVLLIDTVAVTPGAVTFAGQTVNTSVATVVGVTPAAVTITGQSVALKNTVAVTAGAITLTGQTVNIAVPTVVGVTPGALTITGQTVLLRSSQAVSAGALTLTGQTVLLRTNMVVTPGAVTVTGQTVNTLIAVVVGVTPGAITVTGQTVNLLLATVVPVTPGAITLTGQTVNIGGATSVAVTPGAVTLAGQTVLLTQSQAVGAGALSISGQTVLLRTNMVVTPGAVTLTGQTVVLPSTTTVGVTPGALTLTGQAVGLTGAINVTATPGAVVLTGQAVNLKNTVAVTPGAITLQGQTVNTGGVVSVPVTTPGAVTFAGQTVNTLATTVVPVTPAAMAVAGQTILLRSSQAVAAGAVAVTGQTVNLLTAIVVPATPAAVVLTGQTVNLKNTVAVTPAAVTIQGQTVNTGAVTTVPVTPAAVMVAGQSVLLRTTVLVAPGALSLAGQSIGTIRTIPVTPGALTLTGQAVALRTLAALQPGTITITGSDVHLGIPEEYTLTLEARWQPVLVLEGRHAATVASRAAHRPTVVGTGVHVPSRTLAGTSAP